MSRSPSLLARVDAFPSQDAGASAERRAEGRVAGFVMTVAAIVTFSTIQLLSPRKVSPTFDVVPALTILSGIACVTIPWDRLPARSLHVVPVVATIEIALGIRLAGIYGDVAANYYVFVAVFAAYAFSSRTAVASHVALVSAAAALPLLYRNGPQTPARTVVSVMLIIVIAGIVTMLREGLLRRQRELEELAVRDPLTGVGNYRLLSERLDYELARHRRSGGSLTVMLLDLDGFKEINDSFGHLVGDRVLIEVAHVLASTLRAQDTLARQGGDEFSILAPETDEQQALQLAMRVQEAVSAAMGGSLTTSIGSATFPADAEDPATLLALADADLRGAKRNRGPDRHARGSGPRTGVLRVVESSAG